MLWIAYLNSGYSKSEELFPLGWSTFYPSRSPDYDPAAQHDYNAIFRLCPRVHGDTQTRLLQVTHAVVVNIMVDTNKPIGTPSETPHASDDELDDASINGDDDKPSVQQLEHMPSPPSSRPSSPPPLSRSSSSSSISSIFSIRRHATTPPSSRRSSVSSGCSGSAPAMTMAMPKQQTQKSLVMCSIEIPVVVTSREQIWDGAMPSPPAYNSNEVPPSYFSSLEQLPAVPAYPIEQH